MTRHEGFADALLRNRSPHTRHFAHLHRLGTAALVALFAAIPIACAQPDEEGTTTPDPVEAVAEDVVRTGDPYARGFTDEDFPRVQQIAEDVYTYEQLRGAGDEKFTTVSMFVVTSEGVMVADGQGSVEETQRMIDHIAEITNQPITHLIICSDHGDHTSGNAAFPRAATRWVHPTSAALLDPAAGRPASPQGQTPIKTMMVEDIAMLNLGDKQIQILFLGRAHTGGDLSVYLAEERILFMSEAYLNRIFPAMRSAHPSEWVAMIEEAQALDVDTYVPGHGFVESPEILKEELETYRQAVIQVIDEAKRLHAMGLSADEAVEQATFGDLDSWTLRSSQGPIAIRRVFLELDGELPEPEFPRVPRGPVQQ